MVSAPHLKRLSKDIRSLKKKAQFAGRAGKSTIAGEKSTAFYARDREQTGIINA